MITSLELERLKTAISKHTLKSENMFELHSGIKSDTYIDARTILLERETLRLASRAVFAIIYKNKIEAESIGGIESGSISLATAICLEYGYPAFYVRKEAKGYGLHKRIEGNITSPCILLEDVTSTANTLRSAVNAITESGNKLIAVITVVDRESLHGEIASGIPFYSVLKEKDLSQRQIYQEEN